MISLNPHLNGQDAGFSQSGLLTPQERAFYCRTMQVMDEAKVPFLAAGAYALACFTGIERHTKDFDLFLRKADLDQAMEALQADGFRVEVTFPHWLAKIFSEDAVIDLIYCSGNGISTVDDSWFARAHPGQVLDHEVLLCAPEEIIWTKAFIMERERFDGADVAHLLRAASPRMDWDHLLHLFGAYWHVLLSHLILFSFIYPSERHHIPDTVMQELLERLQQERQHPPDEQRVCRGTLLSRGQYLIDVTDWDYQDARLKPQGTMTASDIAAWTRAIEE